MYTWVQNRGGDPKSFDSDRFDVQTSNLGGPCAKSAVSLRQRVRYPPQCTRWPSQTFLMTKKQKKHVRKCFSEFSRQTHVDLVENSTNPGSGGEIPRYHRFSINPVQIQWLSTKTGLPFARLSVFSQHAPCERETWIPGLRYPYAGVIHGVKLVRERAFNKPSRGKYRPILSGSHCDVQPKLQ